MLVLITGILILILWGVIEFSSHNYYRKKIPVIIHVNGTRGKSSVTRLVAAALRASGKKVIAKTTGSAPRIIFEDGSESPVVRFFGANIKEQLKIIRFAAKRNIDFLVLECMAVTPEYQWVAEHQMVKSDIGIITNCRLDHLDVMGPGIKNCTLSLCNTVPFQGKLITSEYKMLPLMKKVCEKNKTELFYSGNDIANEIMAGFNHIEHKENVAIALKIAEEYGVSQKKALAEMYQALPDIGATEVYKLKYKDKSIHFAHSFAANDPESTKSLIEYIQSIYAHINTIVLILNTREDRMYRSFQLIEMAAGLSFDRIILVGDQPGTVKSHALKNGIVSEKVRNSGFTEGHNLLRIVEEIDFEEVLLFGIGNIGGNGNILVEFFKNNHEKLVCT